MTRVAPVSSALYDSGSRDRRYTYVTESVGGVFGEGVIRFDEEEIKKNI